MGQGIRNNLRHYLDERNITPEVLAKKIGISKSQIYRYLQGTSSPTEEVIIDISNTLEISIDDLLGISKPHDPLYDQLTSAFFRLNAESRQSVYHYALEQLQDNQ